MRLRSRALTIAALVAVLAATAVGASSGGSNGDADRDGVPDASDNCTKAYNPDQTDFDEDGLGNTCDSTAGVRPDESWLILYTRDELGNPLADACFDIQSDTDVEPINSCADPTDPGYVDTNLKSPERRENVTQTSRPKGCSGGLAGSFVHEFESAGWKVLEVRYHCASARPKVFTDSFAKPGQAKEHGVKVPTRTRTVQVVIRWKNKRDRFDGARFRILRGRKVIARTTASGAKLKPGKLKITRDRTATSVTIGITKLKPGTLKFDVTAKRVTSATRVTTRVAQSTR
jgi:hypothetical protein